MTQSPSSPPTMLSARRALTAGGWRENVVITWDPAGRIMTVDEEGFDAAAAHGIVLPALSNLHTHSFQRAMAGLAERARPAGGDDFWSWRGVMYRFLEVLTPEDIETIAALVQVEMAEAGYAASAEFHYLHHQPRGVPYADLGETAGRIIAAAQRTGIGLTMLPVLYSYGGLDRRALAAGQQRFGNAIDRFAALHARTREMLRGMPADTRLGVAPHSLRAVAGEDLAATIALGDGPIHIHAAEQTGEVAEVEAALGTRPVRWLLDKVGLGPRWCLIHATHIDAGEVRDLAASGAVAGLCPTTEANLGDGIFPAEDFLHRGGRFGVGSDSNIRISVSEELRMLEVSQRLLHRRRAILADETTPSNGRFLYERAAAGGAQALGRDSGAIAPGKFADLIALDDRLPELAWALADSALDAWIFGPGDGQVRDVWSAGRHIVNDGRHRAGEAVRADYARCMASLRERL